MNIKTRRCVDLRALIDFHWSVATATSAGVTRRSRRRDMTSVHDGSPGAGVGHLRLVSNGHAKPTRRLHQALPPATRRGTAAAVRFRRADLLTRSSRRPPGSDLDSWFVSQWVLATVARLSRMFSSTACRAAARTCPFDDEACKKGEDPEGEVCCERPRSLRVHVLLRALEGLMMHQGQPRPKCCRLGRSTDWSARTAHYAQGPVAGDETCAPTPARTGRRTAYALGRGLALLRVRARFQGARR